MERKSIDAMFDVGKTYYCCRFMGNNKGPIGLLFKKYWTGFDGWNPTVHLEFIVNGKIEEWIIETEEDRTDIIRFDEREHHHYVLADDPEGNCIPIYFHN